MTSSNGRVIIGVDVASKKLDLYNQETQQHSILSNTESEIEVFASGLQAADREILVVMEATGGYEDLLVETLQAHDVPCAVVNPLQIRNFARGCGLLEKSDKIDAKIIARFGDVVNPKEKDKPTAEEKKLRALVHRRSQILSQISAEKNRHLQTADGETNAMVEQAVTFYKQQLREVDRRIQQLVSESPCLSGKAAILNSCPGVGLATIGILLAELPELGTLNRQQVAKLIGVAPIARDSGNKEGKRKTFAGRSTVRRVLYMSALVATRHNSTMAAFYQRLLARGKPKKVALVAVMRKLIVTLNALIKTQQFWRETSLALDKN